MWRSSQKGRDAARWILATLQEGIERIDPDILWEAVEIWRVVIAGVVRQKSPDCFFMSSMLGRRYVQVPDDLQIACGHVRSRNHTRHFLTIRSLQQTLVPYSLSHTLKESAHELDRQIHEVISTWMGLSPPGLS